MGVTTVTAARILKGQLSNQLGPEYVLAMDKFPYLALSKVRFWCRTLLWGWGSSGLVWGLRASLSTDVQRGQTGA